MRRGVSFTLIALLVIFVLGCLLVQAWALPQSATLVAQTFPEVERLVVPAVLWGVVTIALAEAGAVIALFLLARAPANGLTFWPASGL